MAVGFRFGATSGCVLSTKVRTGRRRIIVVKLVVAEFTRLFFPEQFSRQSDGLELPIIDFSHD